MKNMHKRSLPIVIGVGLGLLATSGYADLVDIANSNTAIFVKQPPANSPEVINAKIQALLAKGRQQPLTPDDQQQLNELLLAAGKTTDGTPLSGSVQTNAPINAQQTSYGPVAANTAAPAPAEAAPTARDQAFAAMAQQLMPLTPEQIRDLRAMYDRSRRAAAATPGTAPKPTSSSAFVNLAPGSTPPLVRCASGFISTLVFLDATGQPWPIQAFDIGDPASYSVHLNANALMVQPLTEYKSANMAVVLKGMTTPVMVTLMPGQHEVDYRLDLRLPTAGPNAAPMISGLPASESQQLLSVLDGVPPDGAKAVQVTGGGDCQAWLLNGKLYLRTRMTLMSPGWISSMSSGDGTHAYELEQSPVLLALQHGEMLRLNVEGV